MLANIINDQVSTQLLLCAFVKTSTNNEFTWLTLHSDSVVMKVVHRLYHSQKFTPQGIASLHIETMEQLLYPGRFNEKEWVKVLDKKAQVTISKIQTTAQVTISTVDGEDQSLDMQMLIGRRFQT